MFKSSKKDRVPCDIMKKNQNDVNVWNSVGIEMFSEKVKMFVVSEVSKMLLYSIQH